MKTDILDYLLKQIDEKVVILQEVLGIGEAKDYAHYQNICGEIQGLLYTRRNITDLKSNLEKFDE
jgi:hypothetical protein